MANGVVVPIPTLPLQFDAVPVTVPVMLAPPAETVRPPAVTVRPPLLTVGETKLGEVASTTLLVPVKRVLQTIPVVLDAAVKVRRSKGHE